MFDLKLNTFEDEFDFNQDSVEVFSDFIIAQEELYQAEQELFNLNRAYENLTALQEVVAKHGWNEVLHDLVGDQVSAESLDASCEGALDKITGSIKKVGKAAGNWFSKSFNILNVYIERFKKVKEWLKEHINQIDRNDLKKISSEVLGFEGKIYDINGLVNAFLNSYKHIDKHGDIIKQTVEYINSNVKTVDYENMHGADLMRALDASLTYLEKYKIQFSIMSAKSRDLKLEERDARDWRFSRLSADEWHKLRVETISNKIYFHLIIMSCKALDSYCNRLKKQYPN